MTFNGLLYAQSGASGLILERRPGQSGRTYDEYIWIAQPDGGIVEIPFESELSGPAGATFYLTLPPPVDSATLNFAKRILRAERDVVQIYTTRAPLEGKSA